MKAILAPPAITSSLFSGCFTTLETVLSSTTSWISAPFQTGVLACGFQEDRPDPLSIVFGSHYIPDPEKASPQGEDASFISERCAAFGVADGVGGCELVGIDSGVFARQLMDAARRAVEIDGLREPVRIMQQAKAVSTAPGASTATVGVLDADKALLHLAWLGDSAIMVVRQGKVIMKSKDQLRGFNFPYQFGNGRNGRYNTAEEAAKTSLSVQEGDVVVVATDGLWDNVFDDEIVKIIEDELYKDDSGSTAPAEQRIARRLTVVAHALASEPTRMSPFAVKARKSRYTDFIGGKMDDITVLCCRLISSRQLRPEYPPRGHTSTDPLPSSPPTTDPLPHTLSRVTKPSPVSIGHPITTTTPTLTPAKLQDPRGASSPSSPSRLPPSQLVSVVPAKADPSEKPPAVAAPLFSEPSDVWKAG